MTTTRYKHRGTGGGQARRCQPLQITAPAGTHLRRNASIRPGRAGVLPTGIALQ
jgi:hypothetical protein